MLNVLNASDKENVISLPYRVGLWISASDSSGGDEAEDQEKAALENIIAGFTQDVFGSELVQHIMTATESARDHWQVWEDQVKSVPQDCQKAIDDLNGAFDEKEVSAFKQRLLEIAEAVALAFREYEEMSFSNKLKTYLNYNMGKFRAVLRREEYTPMDRFLNISTKERAALYELADILGIKNRL